MKNTVAYVRTSTYIGTITAVALLLCACTTKDGTVSFAESTDQRRQSTGGDTSFDRIMRTADAGYHTGDYAAVETAYNKAIKESESFDAKDPRRSLAVRKLAIACQEQGKYQQAQPLFEKALKIDRDIAPGSADIGTDLTFLAINHQTQGDFAGAQPLWKEAVEVIDKVTPNTAEAATARTEYARNLLQLGKDAEAEGQMLKAIAINEALYGKEHASVAEGLSTLAEIYHAQKKAAKEEECYKRILAIKEKSLGARNPALIQIKEKYAAFLRSQKRDAEATKIEESIAANARPAGETGAH